MTSHRHTNTVEEFLRRKRAEGKRTNRLIDEKSPYLLQHAFNPVEWYPWGQEAFDKARREDKPIFLSIGYSTCYWCHVMERQVFEDEAIASLMNRRVVSVKVDREELPAVDRVYMSALMGMTGSGGWPMSMFLMHDLRPFFGATYIPPTPQYGRASFPEILEKIHELWTTDRQKFSDVSQRLSEFLRESATASGEQLQADVVALEKGYESFRRSYDTAHGGFGSAPKFPNPTGLMFLLRYYRRTGTPEALEMVLRTLDRMRSGGIFDQLGGGFHRYATDAAWHVPHFEKMLYDQALCAMAYLEAYQISGREQDAAAVREILAYVGLNLTDPDGGFWSAEDAENAPDAASPDKKREGAFYCWSKRDIDESLTPEEGEVFAYMYDVQADGNVVADPHGAFGGINILQRLHTAEETAGRFSSPVQRIEQVLGSAREKLLRIRNQRMRPGLDDKILVSWNGLMASACARAFQVLRDPAYLHMAERAVSLIIRNMRDPVTNVLRRRFRSGDVRFEALLEDYAYLIQAVIDLYESSLDIQWLKHAIALTDEQIDIFLDRDQGGFFDARRDELFEIVRTKEGYDGATPSGNAVALLNLLRLAAMVHDTRYKEIAEQSLRHFGQRMMANPQGTTQFLIALDRSLANPRQVIIAGRPDDPRTQQFLGRIQSKFDPYRVLMMADGGEGQQFLAGRVPFFEELRMIGGRPTAYVCRDFVCELPINDIDLLEETIKKGGAPASPA